MNFHKKFQIVNIIKMEDIKKEKYLEKSIKPISIEKAEKIIFQMKKCVCKISINGKKATGFFAKIPYKKNFKKVLITNNHVINEPIIENEETITIILNNNDENAINIKLDKKRKIYSNENLDVTIIEISENENYYNDYLEIDDDLINDMKLTNQEIINKCKNTYMNNSIYILNYYGGKRIKVSYGLLSEIIDKEELHHKCSTDCGSSGSPILSLEKNKLIGIHYGSNESINYNLGTLIIFPIIEFNEMKKNKTIIKKKNNEITIEYKIKELNKIKLFGSKFIENNKDKCKIIKENKKEEEISEYYFLNEKEKKKEKLIIKLKEIKIITDMSHMFGDDWNNGCKSLISLPNFSNWNTKYVTNMSKMFIGCESLSSLSDISKWNTRKVTNMSDMFKCCKSLSSLPDISKWDTKKVKNMSSMFSSCNLLLSLPDISKWDTKNVTNMSSMFNFCLSLTSLPDISQWKTEKVNDFSIMFQLCESLSSLPDISQWNTQNAINMSYMFNSCKQLKFLPDISKWNTENVKDMNCMFNGCELLSSLPDISKWDIEKVTDMNYMFDGCKSLPFSNIPQKFIKKILHLEN